MKFELNGKTFLIEAACENFINNEPGHEFIGESLNVYQLKADGEINWNRGALDSKRAPEAMKKAREVLAMTDWERAELQELKA